MLAKHHESPHLSAAPLEKAPLRPRLRLWWAWLRGPYLLEAKWARHCTLRTESGQSPADMRAAPRRPRSLLSHKIPPIALCHSSAFGTATVLARPQPCVAPRVCPLAWRSGRLRIGASANDSPPPPGEPRDCGGAEPPSAPSPPKLNQALILGKATLTGAATAAASVVTVAVVFHEIGGGLPTAKAITLAPSPINAYAQRRQERAYQAYMQELERRFEAVSAADLRKVVEAGGGGLGVSYRVAGAAAFVASAISTAIVHPLDTLKTRIQARSTKLGVLKAERAARRRKLLLAEAAAEGVPPDALVVQVGAAHADEKAEQELEAAAMEPIDLSGLYRGILSNMMKEAPNAAIYLGVYELLKNVLLSTTMFHDLPLLVFVIAGALGDAIGSIVRCPAEIVNKRLQLGVSADASSALRDAFLTTEGRQSSFVAWEALLWRDVPYGGIQIALYEFGRQYITLHPGFISLGPGVVADVLTGAIAGTIAAMMTTPADVLVTRLSVQNPQSYLETGRYMDVVSTMRRIVREEGVGALFSGCLQRGVYYAPLIGLFFALYEGTRHVVADPQVVGAVIASVKYHLGSIGHFLYDGVSASTPQTIGSLFTAVFTVTSVLP